LKNELVQLAVHTTRRCARPHARTTSTAG
jgi:hypothetical protein